MVDLNLRKVFVGLFMLSKEQALTRPWRIKSLSSKVTMHVLFSAAVIACPLQTTYCPGSDSLIPDTKTVHSKGDEGKLQSWTKVGILLNFSGVFQLTHTLLLPLPSPHKQRWTHVSRIFSQFQLWIRSGEGELQDHFEKVALFQDSLWTDWTFSHHFEKNNNNN